MKKIITLCTVLLVSTTLFGQCLPNGITITTQNQISDFATNYPGCTVILGDLNISAGNFDTLEGLEQITAIEGALNIMNTQFISTLNGLDNLETIGKDINIQNTTLQSLAGLESLTTISGFVNSVISNNNQLENLNGLNNLNFWGRGLLLNDNNSLSELTALSNVTSMGGNGAGIHIINNDALTSLSGIDNITGFQIINIEDNSMLSECAVASVCDFLSIANNPASISMNITGCNTRVEVETACEELGVDDLNLTSRKLSIYPNPAVSNININATQEERLTIYNLLGKVVLEEQLTIGINEINLPQLTNGMYLFSTESGITAKVMIQN
jgi:hypothetical protein